MYHCPVDCLSFANNFNNFILVLMLQILKKGQWTVMADVAQSTTIHLSEEMVGKCLSMIEPYKAF